MRNSGYCCEGRRMHITRSEGVSQGRRPVTTRYRTGLSGRKRQFESDRDYQRRPLAGGVCCVRVLQSLQVRPLSVPLIATTELGGYEDYSIPSLFVLQYVLMWRFTVLPANTESPMMSSSTLSPMPSLLSLLNQKLTRPKCLPLDPMIPGTCWRSSGLNSPTAPIW